VLPCARNRSGSVATAERVVWVPAHAELPMPADPDSQELCQLAHRLTSWRLVEGPAQAWTGQPASVPEAAAAMRLPAPVASAGDLFEVIRARRSYRDFSRRPVPAEEFSGLLHESFGLAPQVRGPRLLDFYVAVRSVLGIEPGLYQYLSASNSLRLVRRGSVAAALETAGLSQQVLGRAAFVLIWAMRTKRAEGIDGARGYRHVLLDAGLSGEHAYLSAVARGLGVCGIGAFHDTAVNELLRGQQQHVAALYLLGVGHRH
jgi:SagB-type dehydrogenase family enzyme